VRFGSSRAGHLSRLYLRQPPGPERGFGLRERVECPRRLESAARGADRLAGRLRYPMGRTAMPALAPHPRLLDAARQARLDRRAESLGACRIIEEPHGVPAVERGRNQLSRNLLELAEHMREHASPSG